MGASRNIKMIVMDKSQCCGGVRVGGLTLREFLCGDGTVLYPDCGGYMNLFI